MPLRPPQRLLVDDAYTAWFNANSRSGHALGVWSAASSPERAAAYEAYLVELALEEVAARELERLHAPPAAA
jgi:hypothetical protein